MLNKCSPQNKQGKMEKVNTTNTHLETELTGCWVLHGNLFQRSFRLLNTSKNHSGSAESLFLLSFVSQNRLLKWKIAACKENSHTCLLQTCEVDLDSLLLFLIFEAEEKKEVQPLVSNFDLLCSCPGSCIQLGLNRCSLHDGSSEQGRQVAGFTTV